MRRLVGLLALSCAYPFPFSSGIPLDGGEEVSAITVGLGSSGYAYSRDTLSSLNGGFKLTYERGFTEWLKGGFGYYVDQSLFPQLHLTLLGRVLKDPQGALWLGAAATTSFWTYGVLGLRASNVYLELKVGRQFGGGLFEEQTSALLGAHLFLPKRHFLSVGTGFVNGRFLLQVGGGVWAPKNMF